MVRGRTCFEARDSAGVKHQCDMFAWRFAADNSICVETTKRLYYLQPSPLVAIDSWIQSLVHASHAFRRDVASTSAQLVTLAGTRAWRVSAALESSTLWPSAPPRDRAVCGGVGSLLLLWPVAGGCGDVDLLVPVDSRGRVHARATRSYHCPRSRLGCEGSGAVDPVQHREDR